MSFCAPVGTSYFSSVWAAGLYLAWVVPRFTAPAVLRTNNKAGHTAHFVRWTRYARLCRQRYAEQ